MAVCNTQKHFFSQNASIAKKKKNKPYTYIPKFTGSLNQFKSSNRDLAFQLKFKVWNKSAHYSKKKHKSACTKNNKVLKLKPITEAMPHHSFLSWSLNKCHARFTQQERIQIKCWDYKTQCMLSHFYKKQRKKTWNQNLQKNKVPLIKRTLPHVFSLFLLHL